MFRCRGTERPVRSFNIATKLMPLWRRKWRACWWARAWPCAGDMIWGSEIHFWCCSLNRCGRAEKARRCRPGCPSCKDFHKARIIFKFKCFSILKSPAMTLFCEGGFSTWRFASSGGCAWSTLLKWCRWVWLVSHNGTYHEPSEKDGWTLWIPQPLHDGRCNFWTLASLAQSELNSLRAAVGSRNPKKWTSFELECFANSRTSNEMICCSAKPWLAL